MQTILRARQWLVILTVVVVGILSACGQAPQNPGVRVGQPIPEFNLPSLDGDFVSSDQLRGSPVVLNFWATWCGPCVREIPALKTLNKSDEIQVVTIALDNGGEAVVRPFMQKNGIDYTVLLGNKELFKSFNGYAIPYTLVLDSSLRIVKMHRGLVSLRTLERDLQKAKTS